MRTDAARAKRCTNVEHNLNAHTGSEHMASARRAGRWRAGQRSGGCTRWRNRRHPRAFNSVFPSTSSTVTCKLQWSHSKFSSVFNFTFLQPTHSHVITISFLHGAFPWGGWRGGRSPACAWNTGSPLLVGPSTYQERDDLIQIFEKNIFLCISRPI